MEATHLLRWDEQSLAAQGVEAAYARADWTNYADGGAYWVVTAHLRSLEGVGASPMLALAVDLLDEHDAVINSGVGSARRGRGRYDGLAIARVERRYLKTQIFGGW